MEHMANADYCVNIDIPERRFTNEQLEKRVVQEAKERKQKMKELKKNQAGPFSRFKNYTVRESDEKC